MEGHLLLPSCIAAGTVEAHILGVEQQHRGSVDALLRNL
jgi:hypothetical protein